MQPIFNTVIKGLQSQLILEDNVRFQFVYWRNPSLNLCRVSLSKINMVKETKRYPKINKMAYIVNWSVQSKKYE